MMDKKKSKIKDMHFIVVLKSSSEAKEMCTVFKDEVKQDKNSD